MKTKWGGGAAKELLQRCYEGAVKGAVAKAL